MIMKIDLSEQRHGWHFSEFHSFSLVGVELENVVKWYGLENKSEFILESFYYWTTLNFEIPAALGFQLHVYNKVDRLLFGLTAQQIETTAR